MTTPYEMRRIIFRVENHLATHLRDPLTLTIHSVTYGSLKYEFGLCGRLSPPQPSFTLSCKMPDGTFREAQTLESFGYLSRVLNRDWPGLVEAVRNFSANDQSEMDKAYRQFEDFLQFESDL